MLTTVKNALLPVVEHRKVAGVDRAVLVGYQTADIVFDSATGCFVSVEPSATTAAADGVTTEIVDGTDCLVLPGFVNCHAHSSEHWLRGAIDMLPLELWLDPLVRFSPLSVDAIRLAAQATATDAALSGCTAVLDHIFVPPGRMELLDAAVQGFADVGVRLFLAPMVGDVPSVTLANFPSFGIHPSPPARAPAAEAGSHTHTHDEWAQSAEETVRFLEAVIARHHHPERGVSVVVAPSGVQWCSTKMLRACTELAKRHGLPMHTHLVETAFQRQLAAERPDGLGATDTAAAFLSRVGKLTPTTSFAHVVHATAEDIKLLSATGSTVVHNPLSNLRLGSGIAPVLAFKDAHVNVALGTDGASSNDAQSMLEVIKQAAILHNPTDPDYSRWLRPAEVIEMATINGARALGVQAELGTIAPGKRADFSLFDLHALSMLPRTDPLTLVVLGRPDKEALRGVWVNGRRIIDNGNFANGFDVNRLRQGLWQLSPPFPQNSPLLSALPEYVQGYREAVERRKLQQHNIEGVGENREGNSR